MRMAQAVISLIVGLAGVASAAGRVPGVPVGTSEADAGSCKVDTGITLPPGFCATVFADNLGHARHLAVAPDGTVYVNTWYGRHYKGDTPPPGGFVLALRDTVGDGRANVVVRLGPSAASGFAGGQGIALYKGALYAELNDRIVRYTLQRGGAGIVGQGETIVSGMPLTGNHPMHPFVISRDGMIFVDIGSATNACQLHEGQPGALGLAPCPELTTRAGTWRYDANKIGQIFSAAGRYATGIRNGEAFAFDAAGRLFVVVNGRDQLQTWPALYKLRDAVELPAEVLVELLRGGDYGWPQCYYDPLQKRLVLAPEYGGDGGKTVGLCAQKSPTTAAFPAHWAPVDMLIYQGSAFPAAYRGGAFIAFHGSWNRAPAPQGGYNVVFQPLKEGKAVGRFLVFADGFAGEKKDPGGAAFRPTGLATAPDGALYVADDVHGRIWRITYNGRPDAKIAAALMPAVVASISRSTAARPTAPLPAGATAEQVVLGDQIFHGQVRDGTCSGCHGDSGGGSPVGPSLTSGTWLWGDGSLPSIQRTIVTGVVGSKRFAGGMPPKGGAPLSDADVKAVAAYVWTLSR